jgi:hypothetical protein
MRSDPGCSKSDIILTQRTLRTQRKTEIHGERIVSVKAVGFHTEPQRHRERLKKG